MDRRSAFVEDRTWISQFTDDRDNPESDTVHRTMKNQRLIEWYGLRLERSSCFDECCHRLSMSRRNMAMGLTRSSLTVSPRQCPSMSGHDKIDLATIVRTKYVWCKIDTSGHDSGSMSTEKNGSSRQPQAVAKQGTTNSTNPVLTPCH